MLNDYTVDIVIKNKDLKSISEQTYPLTTYCQNVRFTATGLIKKVENLVSTALGGKTKEDWDKDTIEAFQLVRHGLLDVANNIDRLPVNMRCKGRPIHSMPGSEFMAEILNQTK